RRPEAEASRAELRRLLARCDGARSAVVARWASPSRLTRREQEVAGLAARGCTSREIAAQLVLSVRTVDTHLAHVFTKLGLSRRQDLPAALAAEVGLGAAGARPTRDT
ncbi:MAG: hypothetical protein JWN46_3804, partial [Acidimicrobiales bacterium]|nr:hypothetical protein [Acidimicrobiales bacterium]